jgi:hypothetical protein
VNPTYYHGTTESSALSLARDGVVEDRLQNTDRGFYGQGLYISVSFLYAKSYGQSVVKLVMPEDVREFDAGGLIKSNTGPLAFRQSSPPSWYSDFRDHYLDQFSEAERDQALAYITPESSAYSRKREYAAVTEYAEDLGYDIVIWNQHENILVNYDLDFDILPESKMAKSAFKEARQNGEL